MAVGKLLNLVNYFFNCKKYMHVLLSFGEVMVRINDLTYGTPSPVPEKITEVLKNR